ncbi:MAG: nucleotidyltransferase domain-containing protein, partial [Anaerolineaceae bacterium]|nr:nucleotidyltransferase domain-containing protein [Anaerolineaceae bacterium]
LLPRHLAQVRSILHRYLPDTLIWAFGSRVSGTAYAASDLDLVAHLENETKLSLTPVKTAFRDSNLPFTVELLNWSAIPRHFQQEILKNYEVV